MIRYHTSLAVSDQPLLKDGVDVRSVAGELGESGASHDVADGGGGRDGVVLDDLLLGASWDRARGRTALGTWEGSEGTETTHTQLSIQVTSPGWVTLLEKGCTATAAILITRGMHKSQDFKIQSYPTLSIF